MTMESIKGSRMTISLEAVELELALQMQDLVTNGFEESVQNAVEKAGYRFLFEMPAGHKDGLQRVAAISAGRGDERRILLVHLADNGETVRVEAPSAEESAIVGFAESYAGLMDHFEDSSIAA